MQKVGFFGGCFNPPTYAHVFFAKQAIEELNLDKVVFVPVGNFYDKTDLIDIKQRLEMLELICKENNNLEVSNLELKENRRLYAVDIFEIIQKQYVEDEVYYMMGSDNLKQLKNWKNSQQLIANYKYIILQRNEDNVYQDILNDNILKKYKDNFKIIINEKICNISSSKVRMERKNNREIKEFVPQKVLEYIKKNRLYSI